MGQEQTPTIDFSKYQAQPSSGASIDFTKYDGSGGAGAGGSGTTSSNAAWDALKDKYNLPHSVDLSKTLFENLHHLSEEDSKRISLENYSKAWQEANPEEKHTGFFANSYAEAKDMIKGMFEGEGTGTATPPPIPGKALYETASSRVQQAKEDPLGAMGRTATDVAAVALPFAAEILPEAGGKVFNKIRPSLSVEETLGRKLSAAEAGAQRPAGQYQPALNVTPAEVMQHASDEGILLTPGQATEDAMAQHMQKAGTTAAIGGKELSNALKVEQTKFGQSVNRFMERIDPQRMGLSTENGGESIKQSLSTAKGVAHDNAAQGYEKINHLMDQSVEPKGISDAWNKVKADLPMGAEDQILAATPRSMRAVVEDMLSGKPDGFKPTFAQGIRLRSFFRELGETDGLPDATSAKYKQMSKAVDSAMESTANGQSAGDDWRDANAGWKDYTTKYGDRQSVMYKTLKQGDPNKIITTLQNAPATDIQALRQETGVKDAKGNITADGLDPLRRQVVQDIAKSRFNVAHDGIGGYSDSYLKALFSPEQVKEIYLKGDIARRLNFDPNPSGTGSMHSALENLNAMGQAKMSLAAKLSMPKDPLSFLPEQAKPAIRTTPFAPAGNTSAAQPVTLRKNLPQVQPLQATGTAGPTSPITGGAMKAPETFFTKPSAAPPGFAPVLKDSGWEYLGKNSMGINEFKEPGTNISISVMDKDMTPEAVKARIAQKLKDFGR